MPITAAPTVRESVEAAFTEVVDDTIPAQETPPAEPSAPAAPEAAPTAPAQESEAEKAERLRNKDGTFAKGKSEPKTEAAPAAAAVPPKPKIALPSSWKKELAPQWELLPVEVQQNVLDREKQYQTGVSTYKTEADRAKGVMQAIAPFEPLLQQAQIPVDRWIGELGHAHRVLSTGTPQDKMAMLQNIIANNRIPTQLAVQDAQGNWQLLGQQPQAPQPQPQQQPVDVNAAVEQALMRREVDQKYNAFTKDVEAGKHPHYEEVKETMAGLLQSGLADDYASAYESALAMPKHRHLAVAPQVAPVQTAAPAVDKTKEAARARSQAVSVKSSTPSAMTQATGPKSLRDQLSESFDNVTARRV